MAGALGFAAEEEQGRDVESTEIGDNADDGKPAALPDADAKPAAKTDGDTLTSAGAAPGEAAGNSEPKVAEGDPGRGPFEEPKVGAGSSQSASQSDSSQQPSQVLMEVDPPPPPIQDGNSQEESPIQDPTPNPAAPCFLCGFGKCDHSCHKCQKALHKKCLKQKKYKHLKLPNGDGLLWFCSSDCKQETKDAIEEEKAANQEKDPEIGLCDVPEGCPYPNQKIHKCANKECDRKIHSTCFSEAAWQNGKCNETNDRSCSPGCLLKVRPGECQLVPYSE